MKNYLMELFIEEHGEALGNFIYKYLYHKQYYDDFKQEIYLKLLEIDTGKMIELYKEDAMLNYSKRMVLNMFNNPWDKYHKILRFVGCDLDVPEVVEEEYDYSIDIKIKKMNDLMNQNELGVEEFFIELYRYYIQYNLSIKKVSNDLLLSNGLIYEKFNTIKNKLKEKI